MSVKVDSRIISARAICNVCDFDTDGAGAPDEAVRHAVETGHPVSLNTNTFTQVERG